MGPVRRGESDKVLSAIV